MIAARRRLPRLMAAVALLAATATPCAARDLVVFAAASLKTALDAVAADWEAATGEDVTVSYAGSSALARQIEQGAPADVFISANPAWMDALAEDGLIDPATRRDLVGNRLVLVAHGREAEPLALVPGVDLATRLGDGRLAMALVDAVPAGIYGKAALEALGAWDAVAGRVAQADNVRAALALVARGEAPLGIVYATDASAQDGVRVIGVFPEDSHPAIVYPVAVLAGDVHPAARAFADHLGSAAAQASFREHGFLTPP